MKNLNFVVVLAGCLLFLSACNQRSDEKDFAHAVQDPPIFDLTGAWAGSWQDPKRNTSESFTMGLVMTGTNLTGKATFLDANGTTAEISGLATGSTVRILMNPIPTAPHTSLPKTTWVGSVTNGAVGGTWQVHGKAYRGYASSGPWSATVKTNAPTNRQAVE